MPESITTEKRELLWRSPQEPPFALAGFAWIAGDRVYRRMPVEPSHPLPDAVMSIADCTAGGQIRFQTDSPTLAIRVQLAGRSNMHHMPATGQSAFDCYLGLPKQQRYWRTAIFTPDQTEYEYTFYENFDREMRHITLNFPLYQGVKEVSLGLTPDATTLPPLPYDDDQPIVVYGTSITQGGCAARPGMAYTNILSRRFNREFINLGFSGNGKGEPEVARVMAQIPNPACLVLDFEGNVENLEVLQQRFPVFVSILRETHPTVPMLVISRIHASTETFYEPTRIALTERREYLQSAVDALRAAGDARIFYQDGADLLGDDYDECTVDGSHPTDLGFMRMADILQPVFARILSL